MKNSFEKKRKTAQMPRPVAGKRQKTRYSKWGINEPGGCVCLVAGLVIMVVLVMLFLLWLSMQ